LRVSARALVKGRVIPVHEVLVGCLLAVEQQHQLLQLGAVGVGMLIARPREADAEELDVVGHLPEMQCSVWQILAPRKDALAAGQSAEVADL